jgi:hypothetical protein
MGTELAGQTNAGVGQTTVMVLRAWQPREGSGSRVLATGIQGAATVWTKPLETYTQPVRVSHSWGDRQSGKQSKSTILLHHSGT